MTIAILAYGSLIANPGPEIEEATIDTREGIKTPFNVEYARKSRSRSCAPTLVPVEDGTPVNAKIFVLNVDKTEAEDRLYRREINKVGTGERYRHKENPGENDVVIKCIENFEAMDMVLYAMIAANIEPLNATVLAELAIDSAKARNDARDGISYLIDAKGHGIETRLTPDYEQEILRQLDVNDLEEALAAVRNGQVRS